MKVLYRSVDLSSIPRISQRVAHPGFEFPLVHRQVQMADTRHLASVLKRSAPSLKGFLELGSEVESWSFWDFVQFTHLMVEDDAPNQHYVFLLGHQIVGLGSLLEVAPGADLLQVSLWVAEGFQGKGIGKRITKTLEWYCFTVYGFDFLLYAHDQANLASCGIPRSLGYQVVDISDVGACTPQESGVWMTWAKERPEDLGEPLIKKTPYPDSWFTF